jgi:hypothetical protein
MGRIWGSGGWVGPGSRLESRTYLRWFRFLLGYFGWSSDRTEHELVPSLLRALFGGVFWGRGWPPTWSGLTVGRDGNEEDSTAGASAARRQPRWQAPRRGAR